MSSFDYSDPFSQADLCTAMFLKNVFDIFSNIYVYMFYPLGRCDESTAHSVKGALLYPVPRLLTAADNSYIDCRIGNLY